MAITDDPRVKEFRHQIKSKIAENIDFLAKGKCSTYDEYKRRVGIIAGLELSEELMLDVLKNYGKDDDDDD